jgi:hypothetical protein
MTAEKKIGRPRKFAEGRVHATVRFTPDRYADIKKNADAARRSISEEVEARIERLAAFDSVLAAMSTGLAQIAQGNLEVELRKAGYAPLRDPRGTVWLPPDHPANPGRSGFVAMEPGEVAAREAAGTDEEHQRRIDEKIAEADKRARFDADAAIERIEEVEEISKAPAKKDDAA